MGSNYIMFKYSFSGNVMVEKNDRTVSPYTFRMICLYTYTTGGKTKNLLTLPNVNKNEDKIEIDTVGIYSLITKFVKEGKATFMFRTKRSYTHRGTGFASDTMLNGLQESFEMTRVYIKNANERSLSLFLQKFTEFIKEFQANKNIMKKEIYIKFFKQKTVEKKLIKRSMSTLKDDGSLKLKKQILYKSHVYPKVADQMKMFVLTTLITDYLQKSEFINLSLTCKFVKRKLDTQQRKLFIRIHNYHMPMFNNLLTRFRNLDTLKIAKGIKLMFSKEFFDKFYAKKLVRLDIAKTTKINDTVVLNFIIRTPNIEHLSLPLASVNEKVFEKIDRVFTKPLKSLKLKPNIKAGCKGSRGNMEKLLTQFLRNNKGIEKLEIYTVKIDVFINLIREGIKLRKLKKLKIGCLLIDEPYEYIRMLKWLYHSPLLSCLQINQIKQGNRYIRFEEEDSKNISIHLNRIRSLEKLLIGQYWNSYLIDWFTKISEISGIALKQIKVDNEFIRDEEQARFLFANKQIEQVDLAKFSDHKECLYDVISKGQTKFKILRVDLDDYSLKRLVDCLKEQKMNDCRIVRVVKK